MDATPSNSAELCEAVADSLAARAPIEIVGSGSKRGLGRPIQAARRLSLEKFLGIGIYEPAELVLTAGPATRIADIARTLAEHRQLLAFEPPDWAPLYGAPPGSGTLGGAIACNLGGPRRLASGAARDHFLGFAAVNGRAERFKAGGKVVKNVTGYDLMKLVAGSYGTLAVMTEITIRTVPLPEKTRTILVFGLDDDRAIAALTAALHSPNEVTGAAHLPHDMAQRSAVSYVSGAGAGVTALRIEGFGPSVEARCTRLRNLLGNFGAVEELHGMNSGRLWQELGNAAALAARPELVVWRLSVAPGAGPATVARIAAGGLALAWYDWGGGLIWLGLEPGEPDGGAARIRTALPSSGGHATLMRAPDSIRAAVPVFQPRPPALAALDARIKASFDPECVLNPGRM
jgi:glycolate oxidase FAD binding subunit